MAASATKYEEFDPTTETVQEKDGDTILLYVPGYKEGQMRVQLTSTNLVRVIGEKEQKGGKSLRFMKEFPVKPNTDKNRISAKFEKGILQVKLPKLNDQESEKTMESSGKESDQKKYNDDPRNAIDEKGSAATMASSEIDPTTETVQEKDGDTILLYVPGFKKGQMRVQLTSTNLVRVSGEKKSEGGKSLRFRKEFPVKPNTDKNRINAKFENGILQVKLPKLNDQESEKTSESAGKESNQVSDQKKHNDDTRNADSASKESDQVSDQKKYNDDPQNADSVGKESDQVSDQKKYSNDPRNANDDKGSAATFGSSEIVRNWKLSKMALCAVLVGLVVVGVGLYFANVEKSQT